MSRDEYVFECSRCGKCCTDLISEDKGIFRGLTLLPEERISFQDRLVRPAVGIGRCPHEEGFTIIAFQLTENTCPHLIVVLCQIYIDRPTSCRQFPFSLRRGFNGEEQIGFDLSCPSLAKAFMKPVKYLSFDARQDAQRLLRVQDVIMKNPELAWFYDLSTNSWKRYRELSEA